MKKKKKTQTQRLLSQSKGAWAPAYFYSSWKRPNTLKLSWPWTENKYYSNVARFGIIKDVDRD
mgnify:FL=1